jgi:short-subunit dehydrogenase
VRISALCPGPVPTDFNKVAKAGRISGKGLPSAYVAAYAVRKTLAGKRVIVPGVGMRIALTIQRLLPKRLLLAFCYKRMLRKGPEL